MAKLVTSRYTVPGVYIGQLIRPKPGNLTNDARVCSYIGKGSRLAAASNLALRRSFVYDEELSFPMNAPFEAFLVHNADGVRNKPTVVYDSVTGVELRQDQWAFTKVGNAYAKVLISPDVFDPSAVYKISYQSTDPDVLDPIPVANLRSVRTVGNSPDRSQYTDFVDFFVPFSYQGPSAQTGNAITAPFITDVIADGGNAGGGLVTINIAADYEHNYNRFYELVVTSIGGDVGLGTATATFEWSARNYSAGAFSLPPTPLAAAMAKPNFTAQQAAPGTLTAHLELGIVVDIAFDLITNFQVGDRFYFNGVGPGLIEFDSRLKNSNQFVHYGAIDKTMQLGSTGTLTHAANTAFSGTYNTRYRMEVISAGGGIGARFVNLGWATYGDIIGASGTLSLSEASPTGTVALGAKVTADFGAANFIAGDVFDFEIRAPRVFYGAKDDRVYKITVGSAGNPGADSGAASGSWSTGTPEGGFGSWSAETNLLSGVDKRDGFFALPDNVSFAIRNLMRGNVNGVSYAASDKFEASISSQEVLDWSLERLAEETRESTAFRTDVTGAITGTPGTVYVILDNVYESGTVSVVTLPAMNPVSFVEIPNSRFLAFVIAPTADVQISYRYRGAEPAPGQLYYFTANYLRPDSLYNNPQLVLNVQDGRTFLAPAQVDNHLYIMNELVFENGAPGAYYIQPKDSSGSGSLAETDVLPALEAHKGLSRATDLCLLSLFGSLSDALAANEQANDPFEKREQMLWVGAPIGTPIGDVDTPNSLVFLARNTLQTTPTSPALGTRVLVAPTTCTKLIALENGVTQTVTLDGSFVAGATSALVNSFADPAATILRKNLAGFSSIQTYTEPQNLILGQASITYMSDLGSGVYRFEEDITVHTNAEEFQLINATTQKQYVVKVVRREMDNTLISVVTPSSAAAIALIRSTLAGILNGLLGRGLIGSYQDASGNARDLDPNADIVVTRDTESLTLYYFNFAFWIRTSLKRLFGLYAVSTNDFGA